MSTTFSNETAIFINDKRFRYWTEVSFTSAIDSLSTVELAGPYEPKNASLRDIATPFTYRPISVSINDQIEFSGTIVPVVPDLKPKENTFTIGAYSKPGVLGDCPAPASALPLEFKGQNVHEIARALAILFNIEVKADADPGPAFKKVAVKPTEKLMPVIAKLARQRAQVISNTPDGRLLFHQALKFGAPVAILEQGLSPLVSVKPVYNYSNYYSEITGIQPVRVRSKASNKYTVKNALLPDVVRPFVYQVDRADGGDLQTAVEYKLGRMFADMIKVTVTVATWRDKNGDIWRPNKLVRLTAPGARIDKPYDFVIRSVTLAKNTTAETARLELMLPGSLTGTPPGGLPWDA